jgi:hypothetical protein
MNKKRMILEIMSEYSSRLGIPSVDVVTSRKDTEGLEPHIRGISKRYLGYCYRDDNIIYIKPRKQSIRELRDTIAHELIHKAFSNKRHGKGYNRYVAALMEGNMFFTSRGLET